jgi:carbon-monoxide dehydrogenase small subunit
MTTTLTLNGRKFEAEVTPRTHLADFIRERAGLTGTHLGCEHGICGACTVEIDGEIVRSCITFAVACHGAAVRTIEGFDTDPLMARLRQAFTEEHALQCGYCTPGMLIAARDIVLRGAAKTEHEVRVALSGNLCRCTGYAGIVRAVLRVLAEEQPVQHSRPLTLGPVGSFAPRTAVDRSPPIAAAVSVPAMEPPPRFSRKANRKIDVRTEAPDQKDGQTIIRQTFALPHPADAVWARMRNLENLVMCLPGAELTSPLGEDGAFGGRLALALGPLRPAFLGKGRFMISDSDRSGTLSGSGRERQGASQASGQMQFGVTPDGTSSIVSVEMAYKLTGPLAQFARPALVTGLINEIGSNFAGNLDRTLSGGDGVVRPQAKFGFLFLLRALWQSLRALTSGRS